MRREGGRGEEGGLTVLCIEDSQIVLRMWMDRCHRVFAACECGVACVVGEGV